jgi:hypothetical protein
MGTPREGKVSRHLACIGITLTLAILIVSASSGTSHATPAYSCATPYTASHCYGTARWNRTLLYGSYTDISVVGLRCDFVGCLLNCRSVSDCNPFIWIPGGFIDNEMWLIDQTTPVCATNKFGSCWVEAGYTTVAEGLSYSEDYFWADQRPGDGYYLHYLGGVPIRDYAARTHFMILKWPRPAQAYSVFVYSGSGTFYSGVSTSNSMSADKIDIGQELAGPGGAGANTATFTQNFALLDPYGTPTRSFFSLAWPTAGMVTSDNPPYAQWDINPAAPGAPEGGQFSTRCC